MITIVNFTCYCCDAILISIIFPAIIGMAFVIIIVPMGQRTMAKNIIWRIQDAVI